MGASAGAKHTRWPAVRLVSICVFPLGWVLFCFLDHLVGLPGGAVLKNPLAAAGASPSQGPRDPDSLGAALSLGGEAPAWECSLGRFLSLGKSSPRGRLWQCAHPSP